MQRIALLSALAGALCAVPKAGCAQEVVAGQIVVTATPLGPDDGTIETRDSDLAASRATGLGEHLFRMAPGITVNELQGNPLQPDIAFRGFVASPLVGTPQGLSVFVDGVRINQPFAEVVNWDLIPNSAIARIDVVGSTSPQFGRNSLGGAITINTRDGITDPGLGMEASAGSFGRLVANASWGGHTAGGFHWFATADHFREQGWRPLSPSRATRAFAKLGHAGTDGDIALSGLFADTDLNGNGLQEMRLLAADRRSIYTAPDETRTRAWLINLKANRTLSPALTLRGNAFWRRTRSATFNGDVNDDVLGSDPYQPTAPEQAALIAAGYAGFPTSGESAGNTPFPKWRCIANIQLGTEPNETCNGLANRSRTRQGEWGLSGELVARMQFAGIRHHLTLGIAYVRAGATFRQTTQFAYLLPDRTVVPVNGPGAFADGSQLSDQQFREQYTELT